MFANMSPMSLVIILVIVVLLFGTKKLRNMGGDLGGALKNFKKAMSDDDTEQKHLQQEQKVDSSVASSTDPSQTKQHDKI